VNIISKNTNYFYKSQNYKLFERMDFSDAVLYGEVERGFQFKHCDMHGVNFSNVHRLEGCHFAWCNLTRAEFDCTEIEHCSFINCVFSRSFFSGTILAAVSFNDCLFVARPPWFPLDRQVTFNNCKYGGQV